MDKTIYIHIIDGKPGFFDGRQICFMCGPTGGKAREGAHSLIQIRDEQQRSREWRKKMNYRCKFELSHRRYRITAQDRQKP